MFYELVDIEFARTAVFLKARPESLHYITIIHHPRHAPSPPFLISHPLFAVSFPQPQSIELITPTGSPSDFSHHIPTDPVNRSPCPFTNALSNHALLPRTNITHNQVLNVLTTALKLSTPSALVVGEHGSADLWMMQRHGAIEHDASLTRDDAALGDAVDVNRTLCTFTAIALSNSYSQTLIPLHILQCTHITLPELLAFRSYRDRDSRLRNANFTYGPKEAFTAYGETALLF
ncbi:hypothetical protein BC829DRAFT_380766, partial [Chytridium lagenaria]